MNNSIVSDTIDLISIEEEIKIDNQDMCNTISVMDKSVTLIDSLNKSVELDKLAIEDNVVDINYIKQSKLHKEQTAELLGLSNYKLELSLESDTVNEDIQISIESADNIIVRAYKAVKKMLVSAWKSIVRAFKKLMMAVGIMDKHKEASEEKLEEVIKTLSDTKTDAKVFEFTRIEERKIIERFKAYGLSFNKKDVLTNSVFSRFGSLIPLLTNNVNLYAKLLSSINKYEDFTSTLQRMIVDSEGFDFLINKEHIEYEDDNYTTSLLKLAADSGFYKIVMIVNGSIKLIMLEENRLNYISIKASDRTFSVVDPITPEFMLEVSKNMGGNKDNFKTLSKAQKDVDTSIADLIERSMEDYNSTIYKLTMGKLPEGNEECLDEKIYTNGLVKYNCRRNQVKPSRVFQHTLIKDVPNTMLKIMFDAGMAMFQYEKDIVWLNNIIANKYKSLEE